MGIRRYCMKGVYGGFEFVWLLVAICDDAIHYYFICAGFPILLAPALACRLSVKLVLPFFFMSSGFLGSAVPH